MELNELLKEITQIIFLPLITLLTGYLLKWINAKANNIKSSTKDQYVQKYITMLNDTITAAVIAVNQTYVDALKEKNAFDREAQQEAFIRVYDTVCSSLTEEANYYLTEFIGDLESYITTKIEEQVKLNKKIGNSN